MATRQQLDRDPLADDPTTWITIPEFNVLPSDVGWRGFDHHIFAPEIDDSIQGPVWNIVCSMRAMAIGKFDSLADLYAANLSLSSSGRRFETATEAEWFAWGYVYIFEALERWHHIHAFDKLEGSVLLANIADQSLCMFSGGPHDPMSVQGVRRAFAKKGAATRLANSPKQQEKQLVRECWDAWQKSPSTYKGKAAFARDMLDKCGNLDSQRVIERWCLEWQNGEDQY